MSNISVQKAGEAFQTKRLTRSYILLLCLRLSEGVLAQATHGADPGVGDVLPGSAGGDAAVGIAHSRVVLVAADTDILIHWISLL